MLYVCSSIAVFYWLFGCDAINEKGNICSFFSYLSTLSHSWFSYGYPKSRAQCCVTQVSEIHIQLFSASISNFQALLYAHVINQQGHNRQQYLLRLKSWVRENLVLCLSGKLSQIKKTSCFSRQEFSYTRDFKRLLAWFGRKEKS